MLDYLHDVEKRLPELLTSNPNNPNFIPLAAWNTKWVVYERPVVYRLWMQDGENRIYLHLIEPLQHEQNERAFLHGHPWPSAIKIFEGSYEMEFGVQDGPTAKMIMTPGSEYEMVDPNLIHSVSPIGRQTLSLMVTGPVYDKSKSSNISNETWEPNPPLPRKTAEIVHEKFCRYVFDKSRF